MTPAQCIRAAVPDADDAFCDHILWGRTPFPMGKITARDLYKAANRLDRANKKGVRLCELCDNIAVDEFNCKACNDALSLTRPVGKPIDNTEGGA